jgi:hypothetical protein
MGLAILVLILETAGFHISRGVAMSATTPCSACSPPAAEINPRRSGRYLVNVSW